MLSGKYMGLLRFARNDEVYVCFGQGRVGFRRSRNPTLPCPESTDRQRHCERSEAIFPGLMNLTEYQKFFIQ